MTACILLVDDNPNNLLLLKTKLNQEQYRILTAINGDDAINLAEKHNPDLILLDMVMPGMNGLEVCSMLKKHPKTLHIPVLMLSAYDAKEKRLYGLQAGADDFLTVPVNDVMLFSRVKALVRTKLLLDQLKLRSQTAAVLDKHFIAQDSNQLDVQHARILVVEDDKTNVELLTTQLSWQYDLVIAPSIASAQKTLAADQAFDLIMVNNYIRDGRGLSFASYVKNIHNVRHIPIILLASEDNTQVVLNALQMGVNDVLFTPIDPIELRARIRTQLRRGKYKKALHAVYVRTTDSLIHDVVTGVLGKEYFLTHLEHELVYAKHCGKPLSLLMFDIKGFGAFNNELGYAGGDLVLKNIADRIIDHARSADIVMRYEEDTFAVILPDSDNMTALAVAERVRKSCKEVVVPIAGKLHAVEVDFTIGSATANVGGESYTVQQMVALALEKMSG